MIDFLVHLEQPPFNKLTPDGWPEVATPWLNAGAIRHRIDMAQKVARGEIKSIPVERWRYWTPLLNASLDAQVTGVIDGLLAGRVSSGTREAMSAVGAGGVKAGEQTVRDLIALALASPEFQRR